MGCEHVGMADRVEAPIEGVAVFVGFDGNFVQSQFRIGWPGGGGGRGGQAEAVEQGQGEAAVAFGDGAVRRCLYSH